MIIHEITPEQVLDNADAACAEAADAIEALRAGFPFDVAGRDALLNLQWYGQAVEILTGNGGES